MRERIRDALTAVLRAEILEGYIFVRDISPPKRRADIQALNRAIENIEIEPLGIEALRQINRRVDAVMAVINAAG